MLQAKVEWQKKSALLGNLLNLTNNINVISADTSIIPLPFSIQPADPSGFKKRPEYSGMNAELKSHKTLKKLTNEGVLLPKLRIGFENGAFGAYSNTLYNTYQVNASLLWSLPLGRLTYKGTWLACSFVRSTYF